MMKDVVEVRPLGGHRLYLRFEDGVAGEIDFGELISFDGVFAPLRDERRFAEVHVNHELGTICWPGGADLDPDVLYARVKGELVPDLTEIEASGLSTRNH
jgi:hypothetical protein